MKRIQELIKDADVWAQTEQGKKYVESYLADSPVHSGETVFGIVPEHLRNMMAYSYHRMTHDYHEVIERILFSTMKNMDLQKLMAMRGKTMDEVMEMLNITDKDKQHLARLGAEMKCLKEIFWVEVRDVFSKHDCNVGVRNQWYLVDIPDTSPIDDDIFKSLEPPNKSQRKTND